jgi:hypothetical protein
MRITKNIPEVNQTSEKTNSKEPVINFPIINSNEIERNNKTNLYLKLILLLYSNISPFSTDILILLLYLHYG